MQSPRSSGVRILSASRTAGSQTARSSGCMETPTRRMRRSASGRRSKSSFFTSSTGSTTRTKSCALGFARRRMLCRWANASLCCHVTTARSSAVAITSRCSGGILASALIARCADPRAISATSSCAESMRSFSASKSRFGSDSATGGIWRAGADGVNQGQPTQSAWSPGPGAFMVRLCPTLPSFLKLGEQAQHLQVEPDERHQEGEGTVPLHVLGGAARGAPLDEVEIEDEVQRRDAHHDQAEDDPDRPAAVDERDAGTEEAHHETDQVHQHDATGGRDDAELQVLRRLDEAGTVGEQQGAERPEGEKHRLAHQAGIACLEGDRDASEGEALESSVD